MCRISNIDEDWAVARQFCCFAFEVADDHEDIFHQFPPSFLGESFLKKKRIKEVKKLRQRLAYRSFACKSSWILITSLDLLRKKKNFKNISKSQYIIISSGNCGGRDRENPKNYQKICNKDIRGNTAFLIRYLN